MSRDISGYFEENARDKVENKHQYVYKRKRQSRKQTSICLYCG